MILLRILFPCLFQFLFSALLESLRDIQRSCEEKGTILPCQTTTKQWLIIILIIFVIFSGHSYSNCIKPRYCTYCSWYDRYSSYRSVEGTCNNLRYFTWGATHTPLRRALSKLSLNSKRNVTIRYFCSYV